MKRAYRTTWNGVTSIVAAESRARARYATYQSAVSAGYCLSLIDIRVVRAAEYDGWAAVDATGHCWAEDQLENCREPKLDTRGKVTT